MAIERTSSILSVMQPDEKLTEERWLLRESEPDAIAMHIECEDSHRFGDQQSMHVNVQISTQMDRLQNQGEI